MRLYRRKAWLWGVLVIILVLLLSLVGCDSEAPSGMEIRIGVIGGQTGPAAAEVVALIEELEYILDYINEEEGGIEGAKLSWRIVDNKGTPEGAISAYKELRDGFDPLIKGSFGLKGGCCLSGAKTEFLSQFSIRSVRLWDLERTFTDPPTKVSVALPPR